MKNKNLIIIIVIVIILILAAVFFLMKDKKTAPGSSQTNTAVENQTSQKSGVKESLLGLLQSTSGIKCSVEDENGKYTVTAKGDKAKVEGIKSVNPQTQKEEKGSMISDGTWAYIWTGKQGMKFNVKDMEETGAQQGSQTGAESDWKNWAKTMEESGAKYDCQPGLVTDGDFIPPSDVTFQDLDALMKSFQQGNTQIPDMSN